MSVEQAAIRDVDLRLVEIYKDFLPKRIFDSHIHLYLGEGIPAFKGPADTFFLEAATPEDYVQNLQPLMPGVDEIRLNMMPMPDKVLTHTENGLRDKVNRYIIEQVQKNRSHVGTAYILPTDSEQQIGDMLSHSEIRALKPYYFAAADPKPNSAIDEFLPESAWIVADEKGIPIILHMMRSRSLADAENFAYINRMTSRYPDAKLVLAHCGRGFSSWTAVSGIPELLDNDNIWFDMAAICEVGPMIASITKTAAKRTMWGTDWPICLKRGRAISMADDQLWITEEDKPTGYALLAAESLLSFYQTALLLNLDQTQISDIFYNNAARLFSST